eukprot:GFYU01002137.1.p1 GENE.GFYU01002137.1~~GFYU01002137.1.p1  ORF type:complete len:308 (-),score=82.33 GFYU01002137.1:483-1358(-)
MESEHLIDRREKKRNWCGLETILNIIWFICVCCFFLWCGYILYENWDQIKHPTPGTGVSYEEPGPEGLAFPAVTVCNLGKGAPLSIFKCVAPDGSDCHLQAKNFTNNGRGCFTFNHCEANRKCAPYGASPDQVGEDKDRAILNIVFSIHSNRYPKDVDMSGVMVTLHDNEEKPALQAKGFFAPTGLSTLVRMRKVVEKPLAGKEVKNYEGTSSYAQQRNVQQYGKAEDIVTLSFTYRLLSIQVIAETPAYTWMTYMSEAGGLAGLLLGMGAYQVFEFFCECCCKRKEEQYY